MTQPTCAERIQYHYDSRMEALRTLWKTYCEDCEKYHDEYGRLDEYGLSFDYVAPETFNDQPEPYWRYQLSWGGPSDEFRIFGTLVNQYKVAVYRIEYWFLDWYDGASIVLKNDDLDFFKEFFENYFVESGSAGHVLETAFEN